MATNFPASLDTLTNPTSSDSLSSPSHSAQHANVNDAVEALQAKVGVDSSAVTSSLDYKVAQLEAASTGKILQVVSTSKTDTFSASVASGTDSAATVSVTITPTSATSKVFIIADLAIESESTFTGATLYRDGSVVTAATGDAASNRTRSTSGIANLGVERAGANTSFTFLDSPATTSATTYDARIWHESAITRTVYMNRGHTDVDASYVHRSISTLTVFEVSA